MNVKFKNGYLNYSKFGDGDEVLLAFHGFGQDRNIFKKWSETVGFKYTIYAFDLFYHGASTRPYGKLKKEEWKRYMEQFIHQENINQFSVLGYSLGGRFAISTALSFPESINEITLIGTDGIFKTIWFKLATTPIIRQLWKYLMFNPEKLNNLISFTERLKIINSYIADFVRKEMGDANNRKRVYISWNHFKSLGYSKKELINYFNKYSFKRRIILGSKDHIIREKDIMPIIDKMGNFRVDILTKKHHQLLDDDVVNLISKH
ncbi:MAG: alpha/beta hydrolase [Ekhidna sp.]